MALSRNDALELLKPKEQPQAERKPLSKEDAAALLAPTPSPELSIPEPELSNPVEAGPAAIPSTEPRDTTKGEMAGGIATDLGIGTMRATKAPLDLLSMIIPEPVDKYVTEPWRNLFDRGMDSAEALKNPAYKAKQAQSFIGDDGLQLPSVEHISGLLASSAPQIPHFLVGGGAMGKVLMKSFPKAGPVVANSLGYGITNAALVAPAQYYETYEQALDNDQELGRKVMIGEEVTDQDLRDAEERAKAAARVSGGLTALVSAMTGAGGGYFAQKWGVEASNVLVAMLKGFGAEAPFEGTEEGLQSLINDIALGKEPDFVQALDRTLSGTAAGGLPGAGIAAVSNIQSQQVGAQQDEFDAVAAQMKDALKGFNRQGADDLDLDQEIDPEVQRQKDEEWARKKAEAQAQPAVPPEPPPLPPPPPPDIPPEQPPAPPPPEQPPEVPPETPPEAVDPEDSKREQWAEQFEKDRFLKGTHSEDPNKTLLVSEDSQHPGKYRITFFENGEPTNHMIFDKVGGGTAIDDALKNIHGYDIETSDKKSDTKSVIKSDRKHEIVEGVTSYRSGASSISDMRGYIEAGVPFGVAIDKLSEKSAFPQLIEAARNNHSIFIDSGEFSNFRKGFNEDGSRKVETDFDKVMDDYLRILEGVDDDQRKVHKNLTFVMPDKIGDYRGTLDAQEKMALGIWRIAQKANVIFPLPVSPDLDVDQVATHFDTIIKGADYALGIPSNEEAYSMADLKNLLNTWPEDKLPRRVHFLGIAAQKDKLAEMRDLVLTKWPGTEITSDANRLLAKTKKLGKDSKTFKHNAGVDAVQSGEGSQDYTEIYENFTEWTPRQIAKAAELLSYAPRNIVTPQDIEAVIKSEDRDQLDKLLDGMPIEAGDFAKQLVQVEAEYQARGESRKKAVTKSEVPEEATVTEGKPFTESGKRTIDFRLEWSDEYIGLQAKQYNGKWTVYRRGEAIPVVRGVDLQSLKSLRQFVADLAKNITDVKFIPPENNWSSGKYEYTIDPDFEARWTGGSIQPYTWETRKYTPSQMGFAAKSEHWLKVEDNYANTDGNILDLGNEDFYAKKIKSFNSIRGEIPKKSIDSLTEDFRKGKGKVITPFAEHDVNPTPDSLKFVLFDGETYVVAVDRRLIDHFVSLYGKGIEFKQIDKGRAISVNVDGKLVGLVMPIRLGDVQAKWTLSDWKHKLNKPKAQAKAKTAAVPAAPKVHKGTYYFPSEKAAKDYAIANKHPTDRLREFDLGWAIQTKVSGPYIGPEQNIIPRGPRAAIQINSMRMPENYNESLTLKLAKDLKPVDVLKEAGYTKVADDQWLSPVGGPYSMALVATVDGNQILIQTQAALDVDFDSVKKTFFDDKEMARHFLTRPNPEPVPAGLYSHSSLYKSGPDEKAEWSMFESMFRKMWGSTKAKNKAKAAINNQKNITVNDALILLRKTLNAGKAAEIRKAIADEKSNPLITVENFSEEEIKPEAPSAEGMSVADVMKYYNELPEPEVREITQEEVRAVFRSKEFKGVYKDKPHPTSPVAFKVASGWLDAKEGFAPYPDSYKKTSDSGMNPYDPYIMGYIASKYGIYRDVRRVNNRYKDRLSVDVFTFLETFDEKTKTSGDLTRETQEPLLEVEGSARKGSKDFMRLSQTLRTSVYRDIWSNEGLDPDVWSLKPLEQQVKRARQIIKRRFGLKAVNVEPGMPNIEARDQLADAYRNLTAMAAILELPLTAIGLEKTLTFTMQKNAPYLGAYFPGEVEIKIPGRSNSFGHEWMHGLDFYALAALSEKGILDQPLFAGYSHQIRKEGVDSRPNSVEEAYVRLLDNLFFEQSMLAADIMLWEKQLQTGTDKQKVMAERRLKEAHEGKLKTRKNRSKYYRSANEYGDPGYWNKPTEMIARAFEAYIAMKMMVHGETNEFLTKSDENYLSNAEERLAKTFPKLEERERIFAAFDSLFEQLVAKNLFRGEAADMPGEADTIDLRDVDAVDLGHPMTVADLTNVIGSIRDAFEDLRGSIVDKPDSPFELMENLQHIKQFFASTNRAIAVTMQKMHPESQALRTLFSKVMSFPGEFRPEGQPKTFHDIQVQIFNQYTGRFERILKANEVTMSLRKRDRDTSTQMRELLLGNAPENVPANVKRAASYIRKLWEEMYYEFKRAGVQLGFVNNKGYLMRTWLQSKILSKKGKPVFRREARTFFSEAQFPFELDLTYSPGEDYTELYGHELEGNRKALFSYLRHTLKAAAVNDEVASAYSEFATAYKAMVAEARRVAEEEGTEPFIDPDEMAALIQELVDSSYQQVSSDFAVRRVDNWITSMNIPSHDDHFAQITNPSPKFQKRRGLAPEADDMLSEWLETYVPEIFETYMTKASRRIAYVKQFGPRGEILDQLKHQMNREGLHKDHMARALDVVARVIGDHGNRAMDRVASTPLIWLHTIGYMRLLVKATFSSLFEGATYGIRTGELKYSLIPIHQLINATLKRGKGKELREAAQLMNLIGGAASEAIMRNQIGGDYSNSPRSAKLLQAFFNATLLTPLTNNQRAIGLYVFDAFMRKRAQQFLDSRNIEENALIFNEIGIPDPVAFSQWILDGEGIPDIGDLYDLDGRPTPMGEIYMTGLQRFVDQVIQNPLPETTVPAATIGSPTLNLVFGITKFSFSFFDNVIKRDAKVARFLNKPDGYEAPPELQGPEGSDSASRRKYRGTKRAVRNVALAYSILFSFQLFQTILRELIYNRDRYEDMDWDEKMSRLLKLAAVRSFGLGGFEPVIQYYRDMEWGRSSVWQAVGPAPGWLFQNIDKITKYFGDQNSPDTYTGEYRFGEGIYELAMMPILTTFFSLVGQVSNPLIKNTATAALYASPSYKDEFASLFGNKPDFQDEVDEEYSQRRRELNKQLSQVRQQIGRVDSRGQWQAELNKLKEEYPLLLDGVRLARYKELKRRGLPKSRGEGDQRTATLTGAPEVLGTKDDEISPLNGAINRIIRTRDTLLNPMSYGDLYKAVPVGLSEELDRVRHKRNSSGNANNNLVKSVLKELRDKRRNIKRERLIELRRLQGEDG